MTTQTPHVPFNMEFYRSEFSSFPEHKARLELAKRMIKNQTVKQIPKTATIIKEIIDGNS
jgi:hypothetical protein